MENVVKTRRFGKKYPILLIVVLKTFAGRLTRIVRSVKFMTYPATNEVVKLDLEMLEMCSPYGCGNHDVPFFDRLTLLS